MTMKRKSQLLKVFEVAMLKMEQEPRGKAGNCRGDARRTTELQATIPKKATPHNLPPPSSGLAVSEPTSYKRAITSYERDAWVTAHITRSTLTFRMELGNSSLNNHG